MKINALALLIDGIVEGDGNIELTDLSGIEVTKQGGLTFAIDEDRLAAAEQSETSCILTTRTIRKSKKTLIRVDNPKLAFLVAHNTFYHQEIKQAFVHPSSSVAASAKVGANVWIGPNVSIENNVVIGDQVTIEAGTVIKKDCSIGNKCHIYPNVTLYQGVILKNNIVLHSGVVVGADGFGYVRNKDKIYKFPQLGKVIIEDDVEIGANCTIDRGALADTVIGAGTKIDNLCHIAHNVKIGKNMIMAAQSGIAGSSVIGDNVTISGQVAVTDNVIIGKNVIIGGQSCVIGNVKEGVTVWGMPARELSQTKKQMAVLSWVTKNFSVLSKIVKEMKSSEPPEPQKESL